jgi:hypothetical protein
MSHPSNSYYMPCPSHILRMIVLIIFREEHKLWISLVRSALGPY